ncbi:GSCFA domain-containing protein [uncultured Bacteroides sp.]|uniref:GSCFA domain-containing protein n=1 Tax=uncultured Bacteroides sp. TaxID=162156 RepID=UPI002AA94E9B|nr:GSCFA domain-containing protein [uncultured Bacteroides sp.]
MDFRTMITCPKPDFSITHSDRGLLMGSCFAENIGTLMVENKFCCDVNPYGILYNPLSVAKALRELTLGKQYEESDLFFFQECYHSYMHHGSFSSLSSKECLDGINARLQKGHEAISRLNYLIITFGTSWVYILKETGEVVSNCHKLPADYFIRRRLNVQEIVSDYSALINDLIERHSQLKIIFTVSPIRHLKDGLHGNQISKATLLLAISELQDLYPESVYNFPAYEIVIDELRDYRFYADDMVHPSSVAIQYIWEAFTALYFSKETRAVMKECDDIHKSLAHKPFRKQSEEYKRFLMQIVLKTERLKEKYPYLDVQKEIELCHILLNQ